MTGKPEETAGGQSQEFESSEAEYAAKGYEKGVVFAGDTPDGIGTGENSPLPRGKASTGVKDDSVGQYIGPDGAGSAGGDDETLERITGQNVIP
ncbi:MAG: hypothetical protein JWP00_1483 [Chloroflexi bacterium]|jgi:hypothetical protein|nr:hypothetical protein [Chloroflexota bacterium]